MRDGSITNPYMLASAISTRNMISPAGKEVEVTFFELIGKVLGTCGILGIIGYVSLHVTYYFRGFQALTPLHQQYLQTGLWALFSFAVLCLLLAGVLTTGRRFLHARRHPKQWLTGTTTDSAEERR
jgi:H+/Cl- antiporter ClcA